MINGGFYHEVKYIFYKLQRSLLVYLIEQTVKTLLDKAIKEEFAIYNQTEEKHTVTQSAFFSRVSEFQKALKDNSAEVNSDLARFTYADLGLR